MAKEVTAVNEVKVEGTIVFAKQHLGEKGGVNVYFIQQLETRKNKDDEEYIHKHSYLAKQFFLKAKKVKLQEVGLQAVFTGKLKTESYKVKDDAGNPTETWQENTFIELASIAL